MNKRKWGFTLIELIIVIVIIGILAVVALPRYFANLQNARRAEAISTMDGIRNVENGIWANTGAFTTAGAVPSNHSVTIEGTTITVSPNTTRFTYAIAGSGNAAYVAASAVSGGGSTSSYSMCLASGKTNNAATITCP